MQPSALISKYLFREVVDFLRILIYFFQLECCGDSMGSDAPTEGSFVTLAPSQPSQQLTAEEKPQGRWQVQAARAFRSLLRSGHSSCRTLLPQRLYDYSLHPHEPGVLVTRWVICSTDDEDETSEAEGLVLATVLLEFQEDSFGRLVIRPCLLNGPHSGELFCIPNSKNLSTDQYLNFVLWLIDEFFQEKHPDMSSDAIAAQRTHPVVVQPERFIAALRRERQKSFLLSILGLLLLLWLLVTSTAHWFHR